MTMTTKRRPLDLSTLVLQRGAHDSPETGMCFMEAAAYIAGCPHSDHPPCVSPVVGTFCRSWNDTLSDEDRNRLLKPLLFTVLGTATTAADEETRAWMVTDWLARVHAPAWLRLAKLDGHARALEACARIADAMTARAARPTLYAAMAAARAAARDDAWDDAWDAAMTAARDAARDAAMHAAWATAWDAARDDAWDDAWDAARAAAMTAAMTAARDAAMHAAWATAWDAARAAVWDDAWDALAPTVRSLQESAVDLLKAMCAVGRAPVEATS